VTSDNLDYLRLLVNGQSTLYEKHVQNAYIDALAKLAAFEAGVAYGQSLGTPGFVDVMARTGR
jgi:hypothetical protein